jgi:hypothetical protein
MMFVRLWVTCICFTFVLCGELKATIKIPQVKVEAYILGDTKVLLLISKYGPGPVLFALHENESTSINVAKKILPIYGGTLIELLHSENRMVTFKLAGVLYTFDPNRIFTSQGIRRTLGVKYSPAADKIISELADALLKHLKGQVVIALHNNTNGNYSVRSYQSGGKYSSDATKVHRVQGSDADNFFFTTDDDLYSTLSKQGFSVVLQNKQAADDGSLSVYCAQHNISYVNVEAEHGAVAIQQRMLTILMD